MTQLKKKKGIGKIGRRSVQVSATDLVRESRLEGHDELPVVLEPAMPGVELAAWIAANKERLEKQLLEAGAILFRGFGIETLEELEELIRSLSGELLEYTYRSTPRSQVSGKIYTSTEYPADQWIPMHNEMSYTSSWPMKLWFFCQQPAEERGATPIADSRRVYERLDADLRSRFADHGVTYVRNYGSGVDLPWETVFQTDDRSRVEAFCSEAGIELEWIGDSRLRTRQTCQAVAAHPETGETVWFNQAHLFHVSSLPAASREALIEAVGEEGLPRNACFGNGEPISAADLEAIRTAFEEESIAFPWQRGDVMLLDNMLAAHGREPFRGPRKILVGMAELASLQNGLVSRADGG